MKKYMAVDVGGSSIKYACVNNEGELSHHGTKELPDNIEAFYKVMVDIKEELGKVEGIAFSLPGAVDNESGIIGGCSAVPYIHHFPIKVELEKRLGQKIAMDNDANCAALAEVWLGAAKDKTDALFIVLGTGIGGAIVKDRKVHKGCTFHGGEFGFAIVDYDGEEPITWSAQASVWAITRDYQKITGEEISGAELFKRADAGEKLASEIVDSFYFNLAKGIYNLQYFYDPEVIILGGGVSARADLVTNLDSKIGEILKKLEGSNIVPKLEVCHFRNNANLIGAVYNYLSS